jgi:cell division protein FtsQ
VAAERSPAAVTDDDGDVAVMAAPEAPGKARRGRARAAEPVQKMWVAGDHEDGDAAAAQQLRERAVRARRPASVRLSPGAAGEARTPRPARRRVAVKAVGPWHNARLLNGIANSLFALAAVLLVALAWQAATRSAAFPVRTFTIEGDLKQLDADDLARALGGGVGGNFFAADLDALRARLEAVPWVRRADVRRLWPDRIAAHVEEHVALARWNDRLLVNTFGEVFEASSPDAQLPRLAGPPGTSLEVAVRYGEFREALATLGFTLTHVTLSPRYAWQLKVAGPGARLLTLELGRDQLRDPIAARLARFVDAYPQTLGRLDRRLDTVDLRYPNGFALRAPDAVLEPDGGRTPGRRTHG